MKDDKYLVPYLVGENILPPNLGPFKDALGSFTYKEVGKGNSPSPKGTILSQEPKGGSEVRKPGMVEIVVSEGS